MFIEYCRERTIKKFEKTFGNNRTTASLIRKAATIPLIIEVA